MALHLPEKISRTIGDFGEIVALTEIIEHELEKRMVARHGLVKLDALVPLLAQYKNEIKVRQGAQAVAQLHDLIARLRRDLEGSPFEVGRDALGAHALKLDLQKIVSTWHFMNTTTFTIVLDDLHEIDAEIHRLEPTYIPAPSAHADPAWRAVWRDPKLLGDPNVPRLAVVYPGLVTAGIVAMLPGGAPAQDALIRANGLAIFLHQTQRLMLPVGGSSAAFRLFAEMWVNDFVALWELLFDDNVTNEHGQASISVVGYWEKEGFNGAADLRALEATRHPQFDALRLEVRNKHTAHIDPNVEAWKCNPNFWPISLTKLEPEIFRVLNAVRAACMKDIRSRFLFLPPQHFGADVIGLSGQSGMSFSEG